MDGSFHSYVSLPEGIHIISHISHVSNYAKSINGYIVNGVFANKTILAQIQRFFSILGGPKIIKVIMGCPVLLWNKWRNGIVHAELTHFPILEIVIVSDEHGGELGGKNWDSTGTT